jgi:PhnB protein
VAERTELRVDESMASGCLIAHLAVHDAAGAIEFYKRAFGAIEEMRAPAPDGTRIWHASLRFGNTRLFLADEFPDQGMGCASPRTVGGTTFTMHFYVSDTDAVFERAVAVGAEVVMPPENMFWGDRYAKVRDPYGHQWAIAQVLEKPGGD